MRSRDVALNAAVAKRATTALARDITKDGFFGVAETVASSTIPGGGLVVKGISKLTAAPAQVAGAHHQSGAEQRLGHELPMPGERRLERARAEARDAYAPCQDQAQLSATGQGLRDGNIGTHRPPPELGPDLQPHYDRGFEAGFESYVDGAKYEGLPAGQYSELASDEAGARLLEMEQARADELGPQQEASPSEAESGPAPEVEQPDSTPGSEHDPTLRAPEPEPEPAQAPPESSAGPEPEAGVPTEPTATAGPEPEPESSATEAAPETVTPEAVAPAPEPEVAQPEVEPAAAGAPEPETGPGPEATGPEHETPAPAPQPEPEPPAAAPEPEPEPPAPTPAPDPEPPAAAPEPEPEPPAPTPEPEPEPPAPEPPAPEPPAPEPEPAARQPEAGL